MWELTEIVIPKIKTHWEDLAYCMRYSAGEVEAFNRDGKDLHECCKKLFINWLTTDHGPKPKTYETLLKHIKKISNLTSVSEAIEKEFTEGKIKYINNMTMCNGIEVHIPSIILEFSTTGTNIHSSYKQQLACNKYITVTHQQVCRVIAMNYY